MEASLWSDVDSAPGSAAPPLFARVLGQEAFARLPAPVRALHDAQQDTCWAGSGEVIRGDHPLVLPLAWAARLPPSGVVPVRVGFVRAGGLERWQRRFGHHRMDSTLWQHGRLLRERLGLVTFDFSLRADAAGLVWSVEAVRTCGVRLPRRWFARTRAFESTDAGVYVFDVDVVLPWVGLLVRYHGRLQPGCPDA